MIRTESRPDALDITFKETSRKWAYIGLFIVTTGLLYLVLPASLAGYLLILMTMGGVGRVLAYFYLRNRSGRALPPKPECAAGSCACPACNALQTDMVFDRASDRYQWSCFACDHRWGR